MVDTDHADTSLVLSCIMEHGFEHLRGLEDLWKMALVNNRYLTDDSIEVLSKYTKVRIIVRSVTVLDGIIIVPGQTEVAPFGQ